MLNIIPFRTENKKPYPGLPDLPLPRHIPGLIHIFRLFISESRAKTLACIIRVRAHIIYLNPQTCLFYDTMSVVVGVAQFDSFLVFGPCCHHKSVPPDRGCRQSICLWCFEDLPFDKTHLLANNLGSNVTKSYTHEGFFPSLFLFMTSVHLKLPIRKQLKVRMSILFCYGARETGTDSVSSDTEEQVYLENTEKELHHS